MAVNTNATKTTDLVVPEVIGSMIDKKLINYIKFAPLATINTNLVGTAGSQVKLPYYTYVGAAEEVAEGAAIPIKKFTESTVDVTISKIGVGIELTDEAVLNSYGDTIEQAVSQLALSIADATDDKFVTALAGNTTNAVSLTSALTTDDVADALIKFGEDIDGAGQVLVVDAKTYAAFRKSDDWIPQTEIGAQIIMSGVVGSIYGCQVVVSDRIKTVEDTTAKTKTTNFFIVRPGALGLFLKRDTLVETDRDIINKSTVLTADKHLATYLVDPSKAIKISQVISTQ